MLNTKLFLGLSFLFLSTLYLKSNIVPLKNPKSEYQNISKTQQELTLKQSIAIGKEIYTDFCIQCHGGNGNGNTTVPPLNNSEWLTTKRTKSIHAVKFGQTGEIIVNTKKYNNSMPPMGLSNQEVADVMNYIMNSWNNKQKKMVTVIEVSKVTK